ncbi:hypothetical protein BCR44DRAFT_60341 [Catenaria anguillulae PL171]|uniref:RING-type domain-containing protein n=1 Tax=Catenaria anguillulae PL171 TaxID=765915 RepID=A0A1Y2I2X9_9FUNG|nr:hypothetical protein BCR44DRAFT_60341 [Catenaria anguillulae PL171]
MAQLVSLFPCIDEQYLAHCINHYDPTTSPAERVARVAEKIVALNHGYYPTIVPAQKTTTATATAAPSSASASSSPLLVPPASSSPSTRRSSGSGSWSLFSTSPASTPPPPCFTPTPINPTATKNAHLHTLSDLFPATDPAHLRAVIDQHPTNTVLAATDALLSTPRHRLPRRDSFASPLTRADLFKSQEYIRGARARLYNSFPRLWKSAIKAYFAENALDYVATYLVLSQLPDNSPGLFDVVVNTLFKRARQVDPAMYDAELLADVDRLERVLARRQVRVDGKLAWEVNREEAEREGHLFECACCLDDVPWEEAVGCLAAEVPHVVCVTCVRRGVQEYVFGQAGKVGDGELRCFAPGEGCLAGYADEDVLRAIRLDPKCVETPTDNGNEVEAQEDDSGTEAVPVTFSRYVLMRAKSAATQAGLAVSECPFCAHFTVADPSQPSIFNPVNPPNDNTFAHIVLRYLNLLLTGASQLVTWLNPFPTLVAAPATVIRPLLAAHYAHGPAPPGPDAAHPLLDPRAKLTLRWLMSMLALHTLLTLAHVPPLLISCTHIAGMVRIASLLHHVDLAMRLRRGGTPGHAEGARELATTAALHGHEDPLPSKVQVSTCVAPKCGRSVCLTCRGEWVPHHRCYEEVEEQSLETAVELAMSRAIKRVCPSCYLQFTKSDGCNLMTCPQCKYIMCYVCRREIDPKEKYQHFCQHFRVHGGKCRECTRCELYASEDEAEVRQRAGKRALEEWLARHPRHGLSADEIKRVRELVSK